MALGCGGLPAGRRGCVRGLRSKDAAPGNYCDVRRTDWFFPPVWGIWRDRWEALKDDWPGRVRVQGHSWDWWMITRRRAAGQHVIQPMATRSQQIGEWGTYQRGSLRERCGTRQRIHC